MFFNRTPPEPTEFGTPLKFSIVCSRMPSGSSAIRMLRFRRIQNGKSGLLRVPDEAHGLATISYGVLTAIYDFGPGQCRALGPYELRW